ncbi:MAG: beta-lactamase family protein [Candidatus Heimdallarchaeota archaeon]|nr:beta-lactamase family protein [Candidatus Heimdallarchaeota archaeon]
MKELIKKRKVLIFVILLSILSTTLVVIPYPPMKPVKIPIDDYTYAIEYTKYQLNKLQKKHNLPSYGVSLINGNETIYQNAVGMSNIESGVEANLQTVFRAGSISKVFTAVEIMRLYEEGLVDLDAPIETYLPDFSINSRFNDSDPITIRNILAHRSGLPRNGNIPLWAWDNETYILRDLVASLEESYVAFPANYRFKYSNIGYNILGRIIEVVRGELFAFRLRDSLLRPIRMNSSGFLSQDTPAQAQIAMGYYKDGKNNIPYNQYDLITLASGNLYTTLDDMNAFARFIFNEGNVNGNQILNETTLSLMFESQYSSSRDPQQIGAGFFVDNHLLPENEQIVFHAGTCDGTGSIFAVIPEQQLGVVLYANSEEFVDPCKTLALEILEIMYETKTGLKKQKTDYEYQEVDTTILQNHIGLYSIGSEIIEVYQTSSGNLKLIYQGSKMDLKPLNESTFVASHWLLDVGDVKVSFVEDYLILSIEDVAFITCPSYQVDQELLSNWSSSLGNYETWMRHYSVYTDTEIPGTVTLQIENNVLSLDWQNFILQPISQTELIIIGGPFDGETMELDSDTGFIYWQNIVFKPVVE